MKSLFYSLLTLSCTSFLTDNYVNGQSYTSYFTGDTADVQPVNYQAGFLLAGGGPDSNPAMRWLLERADGGDILVLRASGSDGYNDYLYSQLGPVVNSVETIVFNDAGAAQDAYVLRRIREAEAVFLAGGNQTNYVDYWRGSPVEDALNDLINFKKITIGGTSAGMAVLAGYYYAPQFQSLLSVEALNDPYHPNTIGLSDQPFLNIPVLERTFTDTHFEQRDRQGRSVVFLARAYELFAGQARGIAANEASALAIDELGTARAFGEYPTYDDYIFLLAPGCTDAGGDPERLEAGQPLNWYRDGQAVSVYRMPADLNGTHSFQLFSWQPLLGQDGQWQHWSVVNGLLSIDEDGAPPRDCAPSSLTTVRTSSLKISPQPATDWLHLTDLPAAVQQVELIDVVHGRSLTARLGNGHRIDLTRSAAGLYLLRILYADGSTEIRKLIRQ